MPVAAPKLETPRRCRVRRGEPEPTKAVLVSDTKPTDAAELAKPETPATAASAATDTAAQAGDEQQNAGLATPKPKRQPRAPRQDGLAKLDAAPPRPRPPRPISCAAPRPRRR